MSLLANLIRATIALLFVAGIAGQAQTWTGPNENALYKGTDDSGHTIIYVVPPCPIIGDEQSPMVKYGNGAYIPITDALSELDQPAWGNMNEILFWCQGWKGGVVLKLTVAKGATYQIIKISANGRTGYEVESDQRFYQEQMSVNGLLIDTLSGTPYTHKSAELLWG